MADTVMAGMILEEIDLGMAIAEETGMKGEEVKKEEKDHPEDF